MQCVGPYMAASAEVRTEAVTRPQSTEVCMCSPGRRGVRARSARHWVSGSDTPRRKPLNSRYLGREDRAWDCRGSGEGREEE
jgi:hypothetical protein